MHLRAARARASAVGAEGAVRRHEPAVRRAADRRAASTGRISSARPRSGDRSIALMQRSTLRRSASTAGSATGKTQSFGWRYDFDDASFTPDRADSRLAATAAREGGGVRRTLQPERLRSRPSRPLRSRRRDRLAPRPRRVRKGRRSVAEYAGDAALPPAHGDRLPPRQRRGRAAIGLFAVRRGPLGVGAQHRARRASCASRSRSGHCPTRAGASRTRPDRNGPRAERFLRACAGCWYSRQSWRAAPRARTRTYNKSSKRVRSRPNGRSSMNRQARASSRRLTS